MNLLKRAVPLDVLIKVTKRVMDEMVTQYGEGASDASPKKNPELFDEFWARINTRIALDARDEVAA